MGEDSLAKPDRRIAVLAGAVRGASRRYGTHSRCELPHPARTAAPDFQPALATVAGDGGRRRALSAVSPKADAQTEFEFLAFHPENPSSIVQCIAKARENARTIRDRPQPLVYCIGGNLCDRVCTFAGEGLRLAMLPEAPAALPAVVGAPAYILNPCLDGVGEWGQQSREAQQDCRRQDTTKRVPCPANDWYHLN